MPDMPHGATPIQQNEFRLLLGLASAKHAQDDLIALGHRMTQAPDVLDPRDGADDEENPFTPAGYTYLGQFVDHDLTFDTMSDLADLNSFALVADARTPRFDLDNIYGAGPADQPYLYAQTGDDENGKMLLGAPLDNGAPDVMRNPEGRAIIGDPRNDENSIVVQIHAAFIRFHNALAGRAIAGDGVAKRTGADAFAWAQQETRHHYQRLLLDDFLPRILDTEAPTVARLFAAIRAGTKPQLRYFPSSGASFMPIEFAMAAYRLGHSMIRPGYRLSDDALFSIFSSKNDGLRGFKRLDPAHFIDWRLFFHPTLAAGKKMTDAERHANNALNGPTDPNTDSSAPPHKRTQFAYKIDTSLVNPLAHLPMNVAAGQLPDSPDPNVLRSLPVRNLLRGRDFGLPSGEAVADWFGVARLGPDQLTVRGTDFDPANRVPITEISPRFKDNTPLWFYVLAEAEQGVLAATRQDRTVDAQSLGTRLGPVGAAIVAETFIGLMLLDPDSVLNTRAQWRSINGRAGFTMVELLEVIGGFGPGPGGPTPAAANPQNPAAADAQNTVPAASE